MSRCASLSSIASAIAQATARGPTATRGFRRAEEKPAAVPATLGAGARGLRLAQSWPFQALSGPRRARRSPWADYSAVESLGEPSGPNEPQPVPALTPLTHNCPVEPSKSCCSTPWTFFFPRWAGGHVAKKPSPKRRLCRLDHDRGHPHQSVSRTRTCGSLAWLAPLWT
jgi:hypothetical protein